MAIQLTQADLYRALACQPEGSTRTTPYCQSCGDTFRSATDWQTGSCRWCRMDATDGREERDELDEVLVYLGSPAYYRTSSLL